MQAGFLLGWDMERGSWIVEGRRGKELKEEGREQNREGAEELIETGRKR
jgi:hypothetical protein